MTTKLRRREIDELIHRTVDIQLRAWRQGKITDQDLAQHLAEDAEYWIKRMTGPRKRITKSGR